MFFIDKNAHESFQKPLQTFYVALSLTQHLWDVVEWEIHIMDMQPRKSEAESLLSLQQRNIEQRAKVCHSVIVNKYATLYADAVLLCSEMLTLS